MAGTYGKQVPEGALHATTQVPYWRPPPLLEPPLPLPVPVLLPVPLASAGTASQSAAGQDVAKSAVMSVFMMMCGGVIVVWGYVQTQASGWYARGRARR
jgi:hypothetical protein